MVDEFSISATCLIWYTYGPPGTAIRSLRSLKNGPNHTGDRGQATDFSHVHKARDRGQPNWLKYYSILSLTKYRGHIDLCLNSDKICRLLKNTDVLSSQEDQTLFLTWAFTVIRGSYKKEIQDLIRNSNEWWFSAAHASAEQISDFKIEGKLPECDHEFVR